MSGKNRPRPSVQLAPRLFFKFAPSAHTGFLVKNTAVIPMRIFLIILAIIITCFAGYTVYLWSKLSPILNDPRASVQLVAYTLEPFDGPTREINLGYATFRLPATMTGEPVQYDDTLAVGLEERTSNQQITFMPPVIDGGDATSMLESFRELTGEQLATSFEFEKRAIATQPFTFWTFVTRKMRGNIAEATLLTAKHLYVYPADARVYLHETDRLGFLIKIGKEVTSIEVHEKRRRSTQGILCKTGSVPVEALIASLMDSYRLAPNASTGEQLLRQLRATGIRQKSSAVIQSTTTDSNELKDPDKIRIKQIADEIRRRRTERVNSGQK